MAVVATEERLRGWLEHIGSETDAQAIVDVLVLHRCAENRTSGDLRELLELEAAALFQVLGRLAPRTFEDALAIWHEETGETRLAAV